MFSVGLDWNFLYWELKPLFILEAFHLRAIILITLANNFVFRPSLHYDHAHVADELLCAGSLMGDVSERYSGVFVLQAVKTPLSPGEAGVLCPTFAVRETDISRHNGVSLGAPLKPLRDDSALRWGMCRPATLASSCCKLFGLLRVLGGREVC